MNQYLPMFKNDKNLQAIYNRRPNGIKPTLLCSGVTVQSASRVFKTKKLAREWVKQAKKEFCNA